MNLDKYFRCYATIDLDNIRKNAENLKAKLKDDTGMLGVIKTDAYGHGAVPVAKAIDDICFGFAVATAYEAHNLRAHGNIHRDLPVDIFSEFVQKSAEIGPPAHTF